jgi:putative hemolysin
VGEMSIVNEHLLMDWRNWNERKAKIASAVINTSLEWTTLKKLHTKNQHLRGLDFVEQLLNDLNISIQIDPSELKHLESKTGFITVSNHPFGGLDGLLLLKVLLQQKLPTKVMTNFMLTAIPNLHDWFIPVDPFQNANSDKNKLGYLQAIRHVKNKGVLSLFPAGEVSSFNNVKQMVTDKNWEIPAIKLIKSAQAPVVPIFFEGSNSVLFHLLGRIHPALRTVKLPTEITKKKNQTITIRIGKPIPVEMLSRFTAENLRDYLRACTYALDPKDSIAHQIKSIVKAKLHPKPLPVAKKEESQLLADEITNALHLKTWFEMGSLKLVGVHGSEIPHLLKEIGRLREITYRHIGEGSQKATDNDAFDDLFFHLILFDTQNNSIVGAYRLSHNHWSFASEFTEGYLETLFKFKKPIHPIIGKCVELGRSFIVPEYQKKALPLLLLWKGIYRYTQKHPNISYIIGPVSIPPMYKKFSQELIIQYLKKDYWRQDIAQHVKSKIKTPNTKQHKQTQVLLEQHGDNLTTLDQYIQQIESSHIGVPVLVKKYLQMNARVIGLNQDPEFSNVTDALMLVDLKKLPESFVKRLAD